MHGRGDALQMGPRGERVWTVHRALVTVFCRPCPLLGGARSRCMRHCKSDVKCAGGMCCACAAHVACGARAARLYNSGVAGYHLFKQP
eukprot:4772223-Prymnesium_polylepis.1